MQAAGVVPAIAVLAKDQVQDHGRIGVDGLVSLTVLVDAVRGLDDALVAALGETQHDGAVDLEGAVGAQAGGGAEKITAGGLGAVVGADAFEQAINRRRIIVFVTIGPGVDHVVDLHRLGQDQEAGEPEGLILVGATGGAHVPEDQALVRDPLGVAGGVVGVDTGHQVVQIAPQGMDLPGLGYLGLQVEGVTAGREQGQEGIRVEGRAQQAATDRHRGLALLVVEGPHRAQDPCRVRGDGVVGQEPIVLLQGLQRPGDGPPLVRVQVAVEVPVGVDAIARDYQDGRRGDVGILLTQSQQGGPGVVAGGVGTWFAYVDVGPDGTVGFDILGLAGVPGPGLGVLVTGGVVAGAGVVEVPSLGAEGLNLGGHLGDVVVR